MQDNDSHIKFLYELLKQRTKEQSISHKVMPTYKDHKRFVISSPYKAWYIIKDYDLYPIGSIYLTHNNEIGIAIHGSCRSLGAGTEAVKALMRLFKGPFYANINPANTPSIEFFKKKFGARLIQHTYIFDE